MEVDVFDDSPGDTTVRPANGSAPLEPLPRRIPVEVDVFDDSPGDTTVRPSTGKMRELLIKERQRIIDWDNRLKENQKIADPQPKDRGRRQDATPQQK